VEMECDVVIIGGGPAGLAAGLYAARARRCAVLLEKGVIGGQVALTATIENYPGFQDGVNGFDLAEAMLKQAEKYGLKTMYVSAHSVERADDRFLVKTSEGEFRTKTVIAAGGAAYKRLGVAGEERLTGRGVSFCATCDGALFRDQEVAVVGGGDAAIDESLFLARYAAKVHVVHRRDQLRATPVLEERAFTEPKIDFTWNTVITEILGDDMMVTGVRLRNQVSGEESEMAVAGVFIFIGQRPSMDYLKGLVAMDETGHVIVNEWMETDVPGLFAAGDVRGNAARQVVSSAGDGATAAIRADQYISEKFGSWSPPPS
jgi:thioredoxin reductase (NADPH)